MNIPCSPALRGQGIFARFSIFYEIINVKEKKYPSLSGLHFSPENNYDLVGTAHPTMCHAGVFVGWAVPTKKRINFRKSANYFWGDMKDAEKRMK